MLLLLVVIAGVVWVWLQVRPAPPPGAGPTDRPFTDLDTALAQYRASGWELHIPPKHPGPYRSGRSGSAVGAGGGIVSRVRDCEAVVEELRLEGDPAFDQLVVYLETPGGRETLAVLKRPR